jgi:predicted DNA-binding protein (MmcQ/YjbR family)
MDAPALRKLTAGWPGVASGIKWEDLLVFTVDGRMFCSLSVRGPHAGALGFKVEAERFLELTDRPGFAPAPYLARAHWVLVARPAKVPDAELRALLRRAYELVFARLSKRRQRELAGEPS